MGELRPYQPPRIMHLPFIAFTKHLTRPIMAAEDTADGVSAADLVQRHGSPLFVVSERRLREDFRKFSGVFTDPEIETRVAYSIKTNYLPAICAILRSEGAWAEIVSGMEYDLSRSLGFQPSEIIFNGPHKTDEELLQALGDGAIVNIDNFDELNKVEQIANSLPTPARVGIRISFQQGAMPWTKFGFNDDNGNRRGGRHRGALFWARGFGPDRPGADPQLHLGAARTFPAAVLRAAHRSGTRRGAAGVLDHFRARRPDGVAGDPTRRRSAGVPVHTA
jgi:hypothetical protein